jgi:transcriptional regulator with GAF, ATPase, and Fis domain
MRGRTYTDRAAETRLTANAHGRRQGCPRDHIIQVLERTGWRVSGEQGGAKVLGLKLTTLEARMKKLGIQRPK